jgi:thiamine-monophosphate kinase
MKLKDIGEFGLIEEIKKLAITGTETVVGIGDDAAVLTSPHEGRFTLLTTDMLVEGTHFDLSRATPYQVGWKALGCGLSDIAAMAGIPRAAVVALGARGDLPVGFVRDLYRGMGDLARRFTCGIAGGDTVRSSGGLVISVAVAGEVERERLALRSGARPGDGVWVTGRLGGSIRGKHLSFMPRIAEARFLAERFSPHAMMDLSDGLGSDLHRMAAASSVGFSIEAGRIPVDREAVGNVSEAEALDHALYDGEDFELLFTLGLSCAEGSVRQEFDSRFECGVAFIGTVVEQLRGVTIAGPGYERALAEGGFSHFE